MGAKTLLWFVGAGSFSLLLGFAMVVWLEPGSGLSFPTAAAASPLVTAAPFDARAFVTHLVPRSLFEALANNEILQIVVFSLFAGTALLSLGERAAVLVRAADALVQMMLKIMGYVMRLAPLAVFGGIAGAVSSQGLAVLATFGKLAGSFYVSLALLWFALFVAASIVLGRREVAVVLRAVREPILLAFATSSSEAAYPKTLEQLRRVGVPERIGSLVLPLGYSFNLDGSMMYCAFAALFIAQVYNVPLSLGQEFGMLLLLMILSKGMAGVPRASLVVLAAVLPHFNLPEAGLLLILGVDQFLDMGRTATNVFGNSMASAVVAHWEGARPGSDAAVLAAARAAPPEGRRE